MKNYFFLTKHVVIPLFIALFVVNVSVYLDIHNFSSNVSWYEYIKYSSNFFNILFRVTFQLFLLDLLIFIVYEYELIERNTTFIKIKDVVVRNKFKWLLVILLFSASIVIQLCF